MVFFKRSLLAISVGVGALMLSSSASAYTFSFAGKTGDGDTFSLVFTTAETVEASSFSSHKNPAAGGLTSPAYTFTGYLITGISGNWYEAEDPSVAIPIVSLKPAGYIIENSVRNDPPGGTDTIAHSFTDNLFNPLDGKWNTLGKLSYGGVAFELANGLDYQLYTAPDNGEYAGCPGSCKRVTPVPEPEEWAMMLAGLGALGLLRWTKQKMAA
jgi:hypothetical protein